LRGINVGGKNLLKMKELVVLLNEACCSEVKTYLQSGNAVFKSAESSARAMETRIEKALKEGPGIDARVLVLGREELGRAIASNPFPQAQSDPKTLHLFFLSEPPHSPDSKSLNTYKADSESFVLAGRVFYLHAPEGIGRSRLAARVETFGQRIADLVAALPRDDDAADRVRAIDRGCAVSEYLDALDRFHRNDVEILD
ncbi:MAG: DUF1697 domain-containing protein, partial [Proteobacteria bacterium]|nr:DUF1697 domain-containing protein [Pseudomonadota bacterium]